VAPYWVTSSFVWQRTGTILPSDCFTAITEEQIMVTTEPKDGAAGTTDQSPRWEGPQENTPRGYQKATDDPDRTEDAVGETNANPRKTNLSDAFKTKDD
jgi:hypothetical protein